MKGQIAQWGNSAAVRLPKSLLEDLRIGPGSEVEMWIEGRELRIRPSSIFSRTIRFIVA